MSDAGGKGWGSPAAVGTLLSMIGIYFFSFFQRVAVPGTIFDELQHSFSASAASIAGLAAVYLYLYGAMQPVTGMLADRLGAPRVVLLGGGLLSAGSVCFALSPNLAVLYLTRILVGLGASLLYVSLVKAINDLFDASQFVTLVGATMFLGYAGGLAATLPLERLAHALGWRRAMLAAGAACSLALWSAHRNFCRAGGGSAEHRRVASTWHTAGLVLRNRAIWPMMLTSFGNFAVYFLVQATIGKKFLGDYAGLGSAAAASFTGAMMFVMMSGSLLGGLVSRRLGNRRKPLVLAGVSCVLLSMLLILLLLHLEIRGAAFLPCYILLACSSLSSASNNAVIKELNPPDRVGTAIGLYNGMVYMAVATVSTLAGLLLDRYEGQAVRLAGVVRYPRIAYQEIFLLCAVLSAFALVAACHVRETHGRHPAAYPPAE